MTYRLDPAQHPPVEGQHRWHYSDTARGASFAITVIRYGARPHCVCALDTRSNTQAELDAEVLCAALDSAFQEAR